MENERTNKNILFGNKGKKRLQNGWYINSEPWKWIKVKHAQCPFLLWSLFLWW